MKKTSRFYQFLSMLLLLLSIGCTTNTVAQTTDQHMQIYDNATLHTVGRFYYKGTTKITYRALKNEFTTYTTKELYHKAKADRIWGGLLSVTGVGTLVTGIIVRKNNATLGNILTGSAIALNLGSLHFARRSDKLTDQAIWLRNREILFGIQP